MTGIVNQRYGKARVRMMKVVRGEERHDLHDLEVAISLEGDFDDAYTRGDNSGVLPTDTMKNAVYVLGRSHPVDTIESFALHLADHFATALPQVSTATVTIAATPWHRAEIGGAGHPHTFLQGSGERATCTATAARNARTLESGISDLVLLKTTGSGFAGFASDELTTLAETGDRVLRTSLTASWTFERTGADADAARRLVRAALIDGFAGGYSPSLQHTLHEMGSRALDACGDITTIRLSMPNLHCLLVDLTPFGQTNEQAIFMPVEAPHGVIEATLRRDGADMTG